MHANFFDSSALLFFLLYPLLLAYLVGCELVLQVLKIHFRVVKQDAKFLDFSHLHLNISIKLMEQSLTALD